jgi:hypothetical protein
MAREPSYHSRNFSRATKATAYHQAIGADGIARCTCTAPLHTGHIHYDHIIAWAICRYSGPSNCQALCTPCHAIKTGEDDVPLIASVKRKGDRAIGAMPKARHPMPCGRKSRWSKTVGGFRPSRRQNLAAKHRAYLARRYPAELREV